MASYCRRFIAGFAKIAQPLHRLTVKDVPFEWCPGCGFALKNKLVTPPVLAYPCFGKAFTLETDASILGLGAVLSQKQIDQKLHPVAYASRALNPTEKNYSVTELETLAVVWAITHFRSYLYGGVVTVITDHSAVKPVLEAPNPTGKHARWWTQVYGRGIKSVNIIYRAGRENKSADALSRSPVSPAPSHGIGQDEAQVAALTTTTTVDQQPVDTTSCNETNVTAVKVYFPREDPIQLRVKPCPRGFTAGYYWYGSKRKGPGRPPRWVRDVLAGQDSSNPHDSLAEQSATVRNSTPASSAFPASDAPVGTAQQLPGLLLEESSDVVPSSNNVDGTKQSTPIPPDSADSEEEEVETDQEQEAAEAPITDTGAADGITEVQADNNMSMSKRQKASALLHLKSLAPVINPLFLAPASLDTL